jgi:gas vesicle protein
MSPRVGAEAGASAIEQFLTDDLTIWMPVLCAGLLAVVILGAVFALRHRPDHGRQARSLTELAATHALRAQHQRLRGDAQRLRRERDELLVVLTRLAELLDRHGDACIKRPR